ncbi:hypothetical protein LCGC14_0935500 [marine sediment metagenome]|uniref:Uncharacterized protein n=1 Tax=marine sediment metagenome TaxID=412755 RepID=A0A0F9NR90_9ZZZZ
MADLTVTLEYDEGVTSLDATKVLFAARSAHNLLKAVERAMTKKRRASLLWEINIYSLFGRAVIEFSCRGDKGMMRKVMEEAQVKGLGDLPSK